MREKTLAIGITLVFLIVGFSGCINQYEQNDTSDVISLDFITDCCILGGDIDPYNRSHLGVKEINWLDNSTVNIIAYVSLNCAFWIEGGGFNLYNDIITLNYYVGSNYSIEERNGTEYEFCILANCICASRLNFTISNLNSKDCNFLLKKHEIKHLIENDDDVELDSDYNTPDDLEIEYFWNDYFMDPRYNLTINSNGDAILEVVLGISIEQKQYKFSKEELFEIYNEIITNNFFELNETYYPDHMILDGFGLSLRVRANNQDHKVTVSNVRVNQIENITHKIMLILDSKKDEYSYIEYNLPDDLELEYFKRTSKSSWYIIKINSTGDAVLETYFIELKDRKQYNLTKEELFEIYNEIITNNFFELNETHYSNNTLYYGNDVILMVKANRKEHQVRIFGPLVQIDNITYMIQEILTSKDSELEILFDIN